MIKPKIGFLTLTAALSLAGCLFLRSVTPQEPESGLERIEVLADEERCSAKHKNNCHGAGEGSISCTIDKSYYACIGGYGVGCTINCSS